jgi:hypothetical protein
VLVNPNVEYLPFCFTGQDWQAATFDVTAQSGFVLLALIMLNV